MSCNVVCLLNTSIWMPFRVRGDSKWLLSSLIKHKNFELLLNFTDEFVNLLNIGGAIVYVLTSTVVECGFQYLWSQDNDFKLEFAAYSQSTKHYVLLDSILSTEKLILQDSVLICIVLLECQMFCWSRFVRVTGSGSTSYTRRLIHSNISGMNHELGKDGIVGILLN